ncbi:MAG: Cytosolic iron-sulfur protein assembly protein, partial [Paramarteilia canceri]
MIRAKAECSFSLCDVQQNANLAENYTYNLFEHLWSCAVCPARSDVIVTVFRAKIIVLYFQDIDQCKSISKIEELDTENPTIIRKIIFNPVFRESNNGDGFICIFATASFDKIVRIYSLEVSTKTAQIATEIKLLSELSGHESEVKGISFSGDGQILASCGRDKSIWIWKLNEDCESTEWFEENIDIAGILLNAHKGDIKSVIWLGSSRILASCGFDGKIKFYAEDHEQEWQCIHEI